MGYTLRALVGRRAALGPVFHAFPQAVCVELPQGVALLPLPDELLEAMEKGTLSEALPPLYSLTNHLEAQVLQLIGNEAVGYLEAEYFGGQGEQAAVLWQGGQRQGVWGPNYGALNTVLRALGVSASLVNEDEFDAVGLGRHRHTDEWLLT
jgi:hypothetical protein